jgi:hypothetical protein
MMLLLIDFECQDKLDIYGEVGNVVVGNLSAIGRCIHYWNCPEVSEQYYCEDCCIALY